VDLAETADTDGLAHVDVTGDGGGANVEPVNVLGGQLVGVYAALDGSLRGGVAAQGRVRIVFVHGRDIREVLTVSTQPVDKRSAS
jgi:hypothetical protein